MTRHPILAAVLVTAALAACGDDDGQKRAPSSAELPQGSKAVELDPSEFSAEVDNRYWPLEPGTRWTYRELDAHGTALAVVVTATSETKRLANGVTARVVRDTVLEDGELVEDTFDWYAQDAAGHVWYMGERTAEYENGKVATRAGSWEAGADGAQPGLIMPANPEDDMRYRQEYYAGEAEDNGEVLAVSEQVEVPAGHFTDVVMTRDTNALEPRVLEYKLYAPGVGLVLALGVSGGGGREELLRTETVDRDTASAAGTAPLGEPYPR
jgi:hypothetical protein